MSELEVRAAIYGCTRCELHRQCKFPVPYSSPIVPNPFCVIGEAPGDREDNIGEPFVGPAGQLLRNVLQGAFEEHQGHPRMAIESVKSLAYLNVVCCYPHGTPRPEHLAACSVHLNAQLDLLQPVLGLVVGGTALGCFLPSESRRRRPDGSQATPESVTSLRGRWLASDRTQALLLVTWHPAAVLRSGGLGTQRGREFQADCRSFVDAVYRRDLAVPHSPTQGSFAYAPTE